MSSNRAMMALPQIVPDHRRDLVSFIEGMPATRSLEIKVVGLGEGVSVLEMPIRREFTVDGRILQGGLVGVLADYAAVSAATAMRPAGWLPATTGFEVHNLEPAVGEKVIAIGNAIRSKQSGLASADLFVMLEGAPTLCATALATCRFFQLGS